MSDPLPHTDLNRVDKQPPVEEVLDEQRAEHEPRPDLPTHEVNEDGVGSLVNNTGDDGGAASG